MDPGQAFWAFRDDNLRICRASTRPRDEVDNRVAAGSRSYSLSFLRVNRMIWRRWRLSGRRSRSPLARRASLFASAASSRRWTLFGSSEYFCRARGADNLRSLRSSAVMTNSSSPRVIESLSLSDNCLPGLTRCPSIRTLPPLMASRARPRVLKNRAAHSHLSIRTPSLNYLPTARTRRDPFRTTGN